MERKRKLFLLLCVVMFSGLCFSCLTTTDSAPINETVYSRVSYSEFREQVNQVNSPGQGFIVEAFFNRTNAPGEGSYSIVSDPNVTETFWINSHNDGLRGYSGSYEQYADNLSYENYDEQTYKRIDKNQKYEIYISIHNIYGDDRWIPIIDRIDGLLSLEEVEAIEKQKIEELAVQEEQKRIARENANIYDPSNFIIIPEPFYPANFTSADLFEAVAVSEKLDISGIAENGIDWGPPSRDFVSDVVFVSQNGTDITFRTEDDAIKKSLKVDSRTGLVAGQKVRIYYTVYRIHDWQIVAIEKN